MRLLHTKSLQFEEFFDSKIPKYAILSHRWEEKEVSFQDFKVGKRQRWPGFLKVRSCCLLAKSRGFDWVWIDTCCIDKKSSAELSEAINSMFRWYAEAGECYAYLSDVRLMQGLDFRKSFAQSAWFTRGWTLQELLAPTNVIFLDRNWNRIGKKKELLSEISAATGIGDQYLESMNGASVATKMSWVSRRQTSRVEDIAYCLLGIFDVNMPLLYGEGRKAFLRLELEIVKKSDDESIFAWTSTSAQGSSGLLALWPDAFADSADISACLPRFYFNNQGAIVERQPYSMTNRGLELTVPIDSFPPLLLNCWKAGPKGRLAITVMLEDFGYFWMRVECDKLRLSLVTESVRSARAAKMETIYVRQDEL